MEYNDVSFETADGTTLRGRHYRAITLESASPIIVMCGGFASVTELRLEPFVEVFANGGLSVLIYDHRGFGVSDGAVRQEVDPHQQINDWREAITFAQTLPGADPARTGIWGSSFSGGHVLVLGATDRRVKCVVSQVPFVSGSAQMARQLRADILEMTREFFAADRSARMQGQPPQMMPVVVDDPSLPAALPTKEAYDWTMRYIEGAPTFRNEVTLRSTELVGAYEPGIYARLVAPTPLLMIIGTRDHVTSPDLALDTYASALEPKKHLLLDASHFDPYDVKFSEASGAALAWFQEHLSVLSPA